MSDDSSRQGANMAEIHSKGDFTRNLKAKLQNETGYVYRYRKTSGIGEEKKLNVFSSGRYSDTLSKLGHEFHLKKECVLNFL